MPRLHINLDHIATLRQARGTTYPDPVWAASLAELAGAHGITIHLREDRRHIQDRDLKLLRQTVRTVLNLEMAATSEMLEIALSLKPDIVTLVPEKREERTTEGGLDLTAAGLSAFIQKLMRAGIDVSLFIDPDLNLVRQAAALAPAMVELHTGDYCNAPRGEQTARELARLASTAEHAQSLHLRVAAGHGLDYPNVKAVACIPQIEELNIGHAIMARAIFVGLDRAIRDMLALTA